MSLILIQETASSVPTPVAGKGTLFLNTSNGLVVKDSSGSTFAIPSLSSATNTQVVFNDAGAFGQSANFIFDKTSNKLTLTNLSVTGTLSAGDISVSSIANGTSNVDIVGVSGNITISVGGTANVLTVTSTGANISGTLSVSGNANIGNIGTAIVTATGNITGANLVTGGVLSVTGNANIGNIGTGGLITATGNISGGNLISAGAANVATNLNIGNATVNTVITWASATTTSITANQTIASFSVTGVTGVEYLVKGIDSVGTKYSVAFVHAVTDGTSVDYVTSGTAYLGGTTGSLAVNISAGTIKLQVTPASSNSTVWTTQYRLI